MSALAPGERWDGQAGGKRTKPHRGIFLLLFLLLFGRGSEEKGCKRSDDASGSPGWAGMHLGGREGQGKSSSMQAATQEGNSCQRASLFSLCVLKTLLSPQDPGGFTEGGKATAPRAPPSGSGCSPATSTPAAPSNMLFACSIFCNTSTNM